MRTTKIQEVIQYLVEEWQWRFNLHGLASAGPKTDRLIRGPVSHQSGLAAARAVLLGTAFRRLSTHNSISAQLKSLSFHFSPVIVSIQAYHGSSHYL
jgi:hypothetical protein